VPATSASRDIDTALTRTSSVVVSVCAGQADASSGSGIEARSDGRMAVRVMRTSLAPTAPAQAVPHGSLTPAERIRAPC
jgi:hypothetical protein